MLTKIQISEIREHLEKAQNPIFFFDNDADGLCSFLLLRRFLGRGRGIPVKSFPDMNAEYFRKVEELKADYIFILDKPIVSESFFEEARKFNVPVVWIDHHEVQVKIPEFVNYYNPTLKNSEDNKPVTFFCYQIVKNPSEIWLAVIGCISDSFVPDFYKDFCKSYPDLSVKAKSAFDVLYNSQIGKIATIFNFGLKDRVSNVAKMVRFLEGVRTPYDILDENSENKLMHSHFEKIYRKYQKLLDKAKAVVGDGKLLFFQYSGETSMSANLSNELIYHFPDKIIFVAYISGIRVNVSGRGKNVRKIFLKAIEGIESARGGGHEMAIGGQMQIKDLKKFKENLESELKK